MSNHKKIKPEKLDEWAFLWSEARLVLAAIALFSGGFPLVYKILPLTITWSFLNTAWIISGVASAYLLYRWNTTGRKLFGKREQKDTLAFFVSVVFGINLGLASVLSLNIAMNLTPPLLTTPVFIFGGIVYLATAWHLWKRWNESGKKLF